MSDLNLISHHLCPYVQRAVIILIEKDILHRRTYIDLADKPEWFLRISPLGRVPVLESGSEVVFESLVITEYLDDVTPGSLHPADPLEKARHRSWIEFGSETLKAIGAFYNAKDAARFEDRRVALQGKFARIEKEVTGPFFSGDNFHLIDGVWGTIFRYLDVFDEIADFGLVANLPNVETWRACVSSRPSVVHAAPEGYPKRLKQFLINRNTHISQVMHEAA